MSAIATRTSQILPISGYRRAMDPTTNRMSHWLRIAARTLRDNAGQTQAQVSRASPPEEPARGESWASKFERGQGYINSDSAVQIYADSLNIRPDEIWALALTMWREALRAEDGDADENTPRQAVRPVQPEPPGGDRVPPLSNGPTAVADNS